MKASARKSFGEYKPIIIHPHPYRPDSDGRTEVVGQRGHIERVRQETVFYSGPSEIYHAERGVTFAIREDAVAYAQQEIERRQEASAKWQADYDARQISYAQQRAARA